MKKSNAVPYRGCDRCNQQQYAGSEEEEDSNPATIHTNQYVARVDYVRDIAHQCVLFARPIFAASDGMYRALR